MASDQDVRDKIVKCATKWIGSTLWSDGVAKGSYGQNTNKCNLFVYDVLTEAGATPGLPNGWFHHYPPLASQWANRSYTITGWSVLAVGVARMPGDVVAQQIPYSDASGHVMIVGLAGTVIGTGDSNTGPHGTVECIPLPPALGPNPSAPMVFRRWGA